MRWRTSNVLNSFTRAGQHAHLRGEEREELVADVRMAVHHLAKHRGRHARDHGIGHRHDACRTRPAVERGELAEELALAEIAQDDLGPGNRPDRHAQASMRDEEQVDGVVFVFDQPLVGPGPSPDALAIKPLYKVRASDRNRTKRAKVSD